MEVNGGHGDLVDEQLCETVVAMKNGRNIMKSKPLKEEHGGGIDMGGDEMT